MGQCTSATDQRKNSTLYPPMPPSIADAYSYSTPVSGRSRSESNLVRSGSNSGESISRKMGKFASISSEGGISTIHPSVFESASIAISDLYDKGVHITYDRAAEILTKYQKATAAAEKHFPGSRDGKIILRQSKHVLLREGFDANNTLFAQSVCADEINHDVNDITHLFSSYLGEVFHLGGLAGIPFTGKTGFVAFSHHIPDDGHLFILFAPHVGISDSLNLGKYTRTGQICEGNACGAAIGALNYCLSCNHIPDARALGENPLDYQMQFIISQLAPHAAEINSYDDENEKQAALVKQMYLISKSFLDGIVDTRITDSHGKAVKIAILGGIQINMPRPMVDFFQPIFFQVLENGKAPKDLLEDTFFSDGNNTASQLTDLRHSFLH